MTDELSSFLYLLHDSYLSFLSEIFIHFNRIYEVKVSKKCLFILGLFPNKIKIFSLKTFHDFDHVIVAIFRVVKCFLYKDCTLP